MRHLRVKIDKVTDDSPWVTGCIGEGLYEFYAKVEDEENEIGVEKGRITKLVIRKGELKDEEGNENEKFNEEEFWSQVVANYDKTWLLKPAQPNHIEAFNAVLDELEKLPIYKKRVFKGSKIRKAMYICRKAISL